MRSLFFAAGLGVLIALGGCATAPPVDTSSMSVVLLPDEDGNVGAITVTNTAGVERVDKAYTITTVDRAHPRPSEGSFVGKDSVDARYAALLKAQPKKPASFILYFNLGSTELTAESKAVLPEVLKAAHDRMPTEISVFGYADALGSEERNDKLSLERAETIARALRKSQPDIGAIDVQFFGARQPLVQASPNGAEPRNRRAEIMIL